MNQLANEYAYATECNLATLEELALLKSSSKVRIDRQKGICAIMLRVCQEHASEIAWSGDAQLTGRRCHEFTRTRGLLDAASRTTSGSIDGVLEAHVCLLLGDE
jgi:hypothetical protein